MQGTLRITYFFIDLIIPLSVGYLLRRRARIDQRIFERIMAFDLATLITALGLLSFWAMRLKLSLIWVPILGAVTQIVPGLVGRFRAASTYDCPLAQGSFVLSTMLSNRGTAGSITVFILYGEEGFAVSRLFIALSFLVIYLVCYPVAGAYSRESGSEASGGRKWFRAAFTWKQIPLLGAVAGLVLNLAGVPRPAFLGDLFPWIVHLSAWGFLVPIGYAIDLQAMRRVSHDWWGLFTIKFILTPALAYAGAVLVGLEGVPLYSVVILAFSPTAIQSVVVSRINRLDMNVVMAAFVVTMVFYLLIVAPAILLFVMLSPG